MSIRISNLSKIFSLLPAYLLLTSLACGGNLGQKDRAEVLTTTSTKINKAEQLKAAIRGYDTEKARLLCQENPKLGLELDDGRPLLLSALKMQSSSVALEIVEHCTQPLDMTYSDGDSLLMMAFSEAGYQPSFDEVLLKLVSLSSPSVLLQRNRAGETAEALANRYGRSAVVAAIKAKFPPSLTPPTELIGFDNKYVSAKELNGVMKYIIKAPIAQPVFIKKDQALIENVDVNIITYKDFVNVAYVLLPKAHWFARLFLDNPFLGAAPPPPFTVPRASIWGLSLGVLAEDQNSVIFAVQGPLPVLNNLPQLTTAQMHTWFGDYQANVIGQGGVGKIYGFSYKEKEYALKQNAEESAALEKLQFTEAVIEIYGMFEFNQQKYLIMKKGIESLDAMIKAKRPLGDAALAQFLPRAAFLLEAEKQLGIESNDIKPGNLLMTDEGLRVIDISRSYSRGYSDSEGTKFAHSLLEGNLLKSFKGGHVTLDRYYEFNDAYRKQNAASDEILAYWFVKSCTERNLLPDCSTITTYDRFYPLLGFDALHKLGSQKTLNFEYATTHDDKEYGTYKTELPYPQLLAPKTINWRSYFDKKAEIIPTFCELVKTKAKLSLDLVFFNDIKAKYDAQCTKVGGGDYPLETAFANELDPDFQSFIIDAFMPVVKIESFVRLAPTLDRPQLFKYIIEREYAGKPALKDLLLKILSFT